jgi:hypothetical protein
MRRALTSVVGCFVLFTLVIAGQAKPNFSGKWAITGDAAGAGGMMTPAAITVVQNDKTFTMTASSQMGEIATVFNLDGSEAKSPLDINGMSIDRLTKAVWEGDKLVLTTKASFDGNAFETKAVWSLAADGTLAVESTRPDFQGGGAPITTKSAYKKN